MADTRCYMIVLADLTDRERFLAGYARVVPPLVEKYGGRYVLRGSGGAFVEGGWCEKPSALVSEWPSREQALRRLNEHVPALPVVSVFSYHDNVVMPQESSILAAAKIVRLSGMGHVSMPFSRRIREVALEEILSASG